MLFQATEGLLLLQEDLSAFDSRYPGVEVGWYQQTLDHFDPTNGKTFQQRYFLNRQYFKPGGPLFLQIGGEGAISPGFSYMGMLSRNLQI